MNREEMINTKDYDSLLKEVETNSPYKRLPSSAKKWIGVSEMGGTSGRICCFVWKRQLGIIYV